jgi:DNA polymerase-3 subunit gamma/tau
MSYEPLHHKYRPQRFAELVGQGAIATTLSNALRQQRIAPAYLFTGPRGTGKTSSARILAKSLNCQASAVPTPEPCGACEICRAIATGSSLDVIEIDAASNTGVDNIRDLIERAQFAPVQCRFKVYIIDEVHMLSTAAFNALLKTLEEPPNQVVFVLATTDPQRVLPTIISRCQRFDFRRIPLAEMVQHLGAIAQAEEISISPDAVELVAQVAQGGLRDAESLLDQLSLLEGEITVNRVWDLVGAVPERDLLTLVQAIMSDDSTATLDCARHLMNRGREPLIVLQNLAGFYRDLLVAKTASDRRDLVTITETTWADMVAFAQDLEIGVLLSGQQHLRSSEVQVKNTTQPRLWLEVTLMGLLPSALRAQMAVSPAQTTPTQPAGERFSHKRLTPTPSSSSSTPVTAPSSASAAKIPPPPTPAQKPVSPSQSVSSAVSPTAAVPAPTPPPASAQPAQPASVTRDELTSATPAPSQDLGQIWQQVIENLSPLGQALLRDHGRLVRFEQNQAEISVSNKNLLKIAQSRSPDIEQAFHKVASRKMTISFVVAAADDLETTPIAPNPALSERSPLPSQPAEPPPASPPSSRSDSRSAPVAIDLGDRTPAETPAPPPPAISPTPDDESARYTGPTWSDEDEVARAAKSFAQMFNGQIVELDDDLHPTDSQCSQSDSDRPASPSKNAALSPMSGEPDDDVPF